MESFIFLLTGLRYDNWKLVFMEQRAPGTLRVWSEPFVMLRVPKIFNLRTDPYERADITSNTLRLAPGSRLPVGPGAGLRRQFPVELQGIPATAEGGLFQHG